MSNTKARLEKLERQQPDTITDITIDFAKDEGERCKVQRRKRQPGETGYEIKIDWETFPNEIKDAQRGEL